MSSTKSYQNDSDSCPLDIGVDELISEMTEMLKDPSGGKNKSSPIKRGGDPTSVQIDIEIIDAVYGPIALKAIARSTKDCNTMTREIANAFLESKKDNHNFQQYQARMQALVLDLQ